MPAKQILVVDDETAITDFVTYYLELEGFAVQTAPDGFSALQAIEDTRFDLIVLDLMLPDISGLEIAKMLKKNPKTINIPIIMLTAKIKESDILTGFALQAEDYVTKPFSPKVLAARINSLFRQLRPDKYDAIPETMQYACGLLVFPRRREVYIHTRKAELSQTEFELLMILLTQAGLVVPREEISAKLKYGTNTFNTRSLDMLIMHLRKKLGDCGDYITTIRGVGYKFTDISL